MVCHYATQLRDGIELLQTYSEERRDGFSPFFPLNRKKTNHIERNRNTLLLFPCPRGKAKVTAEKKKIVHAKSCSMSGMYFH